jgi:hypothetical protein
MQMIVEGSSEMLVSNKLYGVTHQKIVVLGLDVLTWEYKYRTLWAPSVYNLCNYELINATSSA